MSEPSAGLRAETGPVVLFDVECPLCNRSVAFLARHDRTHRLRYVEERSGGAGSWVKW